MLAGDPVLADLPAPLVKTSEKQTPAHYETPVFGSGGSFGAGVSITFTGPGNITEVYRMIGENAARNGWVPEGVGSTGLTSRWLKTHPDGTPATLVLLPLDEGAATQGNTYALLGGI